NEQDGLAPKGNERKCRAERDRAHALSGERARETDAPKARGVQAARETFEAARDRILEPHRSVASASAKARAARLARRSRDAAPCPRATRGTVPKSLAGSSRTRSAGPA